MNLFDVLFMRKTGIIKNDSNMFDTLFASEIRGKESVLYPSDNLFPDDTVYPKTNAIQSIS